MKLQSTKINVIILAALFLLGFYLWGIYFNWGNIPYDFHDWAEVNIPRLAAVQDAFRSNTFPLHFLVGNVLRCGAGCDRYFSAIDGIISPDIIFLKWMTIGQWVLLHTWLLYAAGFWGMLALRRWFNLSIPLFAMAFLLFFFNGHILAHFSIGHVTWGGYLLFPWFVYLVDKFVQGDNSWAWVLKVSLLLFCIYIQGSFHQFVWALTFLGFLSLVYFRRFFTVFKAMVFSCLVNAIRLLPPVLSFSKFNHDFLGGYPSLIDLYISLTHPVLPTEALPNTHIVSNLGYWEFDLFIGKVGLVFLLVAGLAWVASQVYSRKFDWVLIPIAVLALLSYQSVYLLFRQLPIPLLQGERVTARIISLPFVFFIFLSIAALQKWINRLGRRKWIFEAAMLPVVIYQAVVLMNSGLSWRVTEAFKAFRYTPVDITRNLVNNHTDPIYFLALGSGLLISLLSFAALIWLARRETLPLAQKEGY